MMSREGGAVAPGSDEAAAHLKEAIMNGETEDVICLIQTKANLDYTYNDDEIPLSLAIKTGSVDITQRLLSAKAAVNNYSDPSGNTLLHLAACQEEPTDLLQSLLQKKASVFPTNNNNKKPFELVDKFSADRLLKMFKTAKIAQTKQQSRAAALALPEAGGGGSPANPSATPATLVQPDTVRVVKTPDVLSKDRDVV